MKSNLIDLLACPETGSSLRLVVHKRIKDEIIEGEIISDGNGRKYPIYLGIPRFVTRDAYVSSFSVQRRYVRRYLDHYRKDRSGYELFFPTTGFDEAKLKSGPILEVGCGYGRFLDVLSNYGVETIVGVDLSTDSIELAQDFLGNRPNVHLVQCDLFRLPFRRQAFSHVYSIGVLHHTPSTRDAVEAIYPVVRKGGELAIWVYPPEMKKSTDVWRRITTRLSFPVLFSLCILNQALFSWVRALPGGWRFGKLIPGAQPGGGSRFWLRVLSDFDAFSPTYATSHEPEEVESWFHQLGLHRVQILPRRTSVKGTRPDTIQSS